jgi:hypothetical protein
MPSVIAIDERLIRLVPPRSQLKIGRIVGQALDSEAVFFALIKRTEALIEEISRLRALQRQSVERARELGDDQKDAAAPFDDAIRDLEGELQRLGRDRQRREDRRTNDQQVVAQVRAFLERQSASNTVLVAVTTSAPKFHDQTVTQAIERIRAEIAAATQELITLQRAPLPSGEMRQRAKAFVDELAAIGRPTLRIASGTFDIEWHPGVYGGPMAPSSIAIFAALDPDRLLALIETEINKVSGSGLASSERPRRQQQIEDRILALERGEESLIEEAHEDGHDVARRPAASPLAILAVKTAVAQAKAS